MSWILVVVVVVVGFVGSSLGYYAPLMGPLMTEEEVHS